MINVHNVTNCGLEKIKSHVHIINVGQQKINVYIK